jgi:phenylalanine-4-hydroxylase
MTKKNDHSLPFSIEQEYGKYTAAEHALWALLYRRQMDTIRQVASPHFTNGLRLLQFTAEKIPDFKQVNNYLTEITGWKIYAVPGLIANDLFFHRMAAKQFGATCWLRTMEQLDYLEEPDMFHDVFGHVPLLADPVISNFLEGLAGIAVCHLDNEIVIEYIARLYWYTIEFGLIREGEELKIYGAGILSSIGETKFCLSPQANPVPFEVERILQTPYIKDNFQQQYFVLSSIHQLEEAVEKLKRYIYQENYTLNYE